MNIMKLPLKIFGWIFVAIAMVDLTITVLVYRHAQSFIQTASRAQATITKLVERKDDDHGTMYYPVFTFIDSTGQVKEIYSSSGSFPPAYQVGEKVNVLYPPADPKHAKIDGFWELWLWPVLLGTFALMWLFVATLLFVVRFVIGRYGRKAVATPGA